MIIQAWLLIGGSEYGMLNILRRLALAGYRVTMVLTNVQHPEGFALRPQVAEYTHDIHFLPAFLRTVDWPRYIKHLLDSRGISTVLFSNSLFVYELLPAFVEECPLVRWIDYLHNEVRVKLVRPQVKVSQRLLQAFDGWKFQGFPSLSSASRRHIDRTLACSEHLRDLLIDNGHPSEHVGVLKLGIDTNNVPKDPAVISRAIRDTLHLPHSAIVIACIARLDTQKRPWLLVVCQIVCFALLAELADWPSRISWKRSKQSSKPTSCRRKTSSCLSLEMVLFAMCWKTD